ncbi:hypothetical protein BKA69DRAFT_1077463 [Paraphysoderma sedebokerense]|nr:hypothetical protein BKA69DRAFT_1077463 [Paraphysoderma sedebokerense]
MRMVFWKDTLDKMSKGSPPDQPVAKVLSAAITQYKLSSIWFKRIVQAREDNLADKQFMSIADLETYSENTASSLLYLQLELLGVKNVQADHIASHIGKSIGIATILRGTAFHARNKRVYLPADICAKHGLSAEEIIRTGPSEKLNDTIFEIATTANDHLITARTHYSQTNPPPTSAFPVFLSAVPTTVFLNKLESTNFNIFNPKILSKEATLPWKLWKSNWLKKF